MVKSMCIGALAVGAAALGIVSGCGEESPADAANAAVTATAAAPTPAAVAVTLGEGREFSLSAAPAQSQGQVDFAVTNAGKVAHEFVVVSTDRAASDLGTPEADETGAVDEIGDVPVGETRHLTVTLPAGHYALVCNLPGHYVGGMHADFTVR